MTHAKEVYPRIEPQIIQHKGKIVAIDEKSGDYFIGETAIDAYHEAVKKIPGRKFVFKRIGFQHTYFVGALPQWTSLPS